MKAKLKKYRPVILCTATNSPYLATGFECYDKKRDALTFTGSNVVIAHPPCRAFGRLRHLVSKENVEIDMKLAYKCIFSVQRNGGILEHPAHSKIFDWGDLPKPNEPSDYYGGYTISINQHWFGHKCKKDTWLYIVGLPKELLPRLPISFDAVEYIIGTPKKNKAIKELPKAERHLTPPKLVEFLCSIAFCIAREKRHADLF